MSSIPLPALGIKPPAAAPDPIDQFSKIQGIRDLIARNQLEQQQTQGAQLENQKNQIALNDQNGLHKAMIDSGGDPDKLRAAITDPKYGISPNGQFSTIKMFNDYKASQITLDEATRKDNIDGDSAVADKYSKIGQLPADQQPSAVNDLKGDTVFLKSLPAGARQDVLNFQYNGPDSVSMMEKSHTTRAALTERADKEASAAKNAAQAREAAATASLNEAKAALLKTPQDYGAAVDSVIDPQKYPAVNSRVKAQMQFAQRNLAIDPEGPAKVLAAGQGEVNEREKLTDPVMQKARAEQTAQNQQALINVQSKGAPQNPASAGKSGDAYLQTLDPARAARVKAIAEGREPEPTGAALRSPFAQSLMNDVYAYEPDWSSQRAQIRKAFTTGKDADNIGALNTATVHLDALGEAAKALANGNFTPGNAAYNKIKELFGSSAPTTFETIKNAVAGEQANALKGSATDIEIANTGKTINAANSPQQLADAIDKASMPIMYQKLNTYKERYEQQIPNDKVYSPVLPSAAAAFQKHGVGANAPSAGGHIIAIGDKKYQYKGSGDTADLKNYAEVKKPQ